MAYQNGGNQQRVSTDKFGNQFILKRASKVVNKKTGETYDIHKAYFEIKGELYKVEVSNANSDDKNGNESKWLKMTKQTKKQQTRSSF